MYCLYARGGTGVGTVGVSVVCVGCACSCVGDGVDDVVVVVEYAVAAYRDIVRGFDAIDGIVVVYWVWTL